MFPHPPGYQLPTALQRQPALFYLAHLETDGYLATQACDLPGSEAFRRDDRFNRHHVTICANRFNTLDSQVRCEAIAVPAFDSRAAMIGGHLKIDEAVVREELQATF